MKNRLAIGAMVSVLALGACTTAGGTPATAPPVTEAPVTTSTAASTPTTTFATTTTPDRVAEIQAIFQDLEVRRLQAIMDQDEEAFRAVFANDEYAERSMVLMDEVTVLDATSVKFSVVKVFSDQPGCIAVAGSIDATGASEGGGVGDMKDFVIESALTGWGLSWVGEGWRCDGPHPFSD